MTGRLNHDKLKRRERGRRGERIAEDATLHPRRDNSLRGWRTEYPEQFPVIITRVEDQ